VCGAGSCEEAATDGSAEVRLLSYQNFGEAKDKYGHSYVANHKVPFFHDSDFQN